VRNTNLGIKISFVKVGNLYRMVRKYSKESVILTLCDKNSKAMSLIIKETSEPFFVLEISNNSNATTFTRCLKVIIGNIIGCIGITEKEFISGKDSRAKTKVIEIK
jgi:hypothetical protein